MVTLVLVHFGLLTLMLDRKFDRFFNAAQHRLGPGTDFVETYVAAKEWRAGNGIYGHGVGFGYRYHPAYVMTVGNLLSRTDLRSAHYIWVCLSALLWVIGLLYIRRLLPDIKHLLGALVLLTVFSPYYLDVYMGNSTFVVAILLLIAFDFYGRQRYVPFAVIFTASVIIKPIGLVFVPLLLARKEFVTLGAIALAVIATAFPYFYSDPQGWQIFWHVNTASERATGWLLHAGSQGLHGMLVSLFSRISDIPTAALGSLDQLPTMFRVIIKGYPWCLIALTVWLTVKLRRNVSGAIFLAVATYLLGYKDVWEHSYAFAILGLVHLWVSGLVNRRLLVICAIGLAIPTGFVFYDVPLPPGPYDPEQYWSLGTSILHHATKPLWMLMLYGACVVGALQHRSDAVTGTHPAA